MKSGQTLVMLLVFMSMAITVTTASVAVSISNSYSNSRLHMSNQALAVAEAGMENALLRLLRDPLYSGETLPVGDGVATIVTSGTNPVIITSTGQVGDFQRTVQVSGSFVGLIFNINSWNQLF